MTKKSHILYDNGVRKRSHILYFNGMRKRSHILYYNGMTKRSQKLYNGMRKRSHIRYCTIAVWRWEATSCTVTVWRRKATYGTVLAAGGTHLSCVSLQSVRDWMASRRSSAGISSVGRTTRRISYRIKSGHQKIFFKYIFGGLKGVDHSFAYVAHFVFLRDVWIRTQRAAEASRRATNLATHLPQSWPPISLLSHPSPSILATHLPP